MTEQDDETVREAISRELKRNGQVYYVYNNVRTISEKASRIAALCPEARVGFAHGQMNERELEDVMYSFIEHEIDVLVSTTIVETGLDISNVNTMIIENADRMGLSQLYQLRGRVGRSDRMAYAFLMYKKDKVLAEVAQKRLSAIREFTALGSGIRIAMRDLEIRGAGNLLGKKQSGNMEAVGYDLYCKMLNEAVRAQKGMGIINDFDTAIDILMDAYIPDDYITDEYQKLDLYKRISQIETREDMSEMTDELTDRFGDVPQSVELLIRCAYTRAAAHRAYITKVSRRGSKTDILLYEDAKIMPQKIPDYLAKYPGQLYFTANPAPKFEYHQKNKGMVFLMNELAELFDEMYEEICEKEIS